MAKPMFDAEALITQFENATAKQGAQLKKAATDATLAGLRGRELTLKNIRGALQAVSAAANAGAAKNVVAGLDPERLLEQAVAGMDDALLKAVDAHHLALNQLRTPGADLQEKHLKKALGDLEKLEDTFFATIQKAAESAGAPLAGAWGPVLEKFQTGGSKAGAQASTTLAQMAEQAQDALRQHRAVGLRAAQTLAESYSAMVTGVLIGMADAVAATNQAAVARKKK